MTRKAVRLAAVGSLAALAATGVVLGAGPGRSYGGPVLATGAAPAGGPCPTATHPDATHHEPYQLTFTGSLSGSLSITSSPAGPVTLPHIGGTFCGLLELPLEQATVAPAHLALSPVSATIARATVPATVLAGGETVGTVAMTPAADNGLDLTLVAPVAARTGLFGVSCVLPVLLSLSTTATGGAALVGPLADAHATVAQNGFTIGQAVSTGPGGTCPDYLAGQVDSLLGLPNANTTTTVGVNLSVVIP